MTGLEVIPKIAELLASLIEKASDHKTMSLAKQIQTYQVILERDFEVRLNEKDTEIARMKKVLTERDAKIDELTLKFQKPKTEMFGGMMAGKSTLDKAHQED
jgi:DNA-directed RNA polymerase beta' subunit